MEICRAKNWNHVVCARPAVPANTENPICLHLIVYLYATKALENNRQFV